MEPIEPNVDLDELCRTGQAICQPVVEISGLSDHPYWIDFLRTFFESIMSIFV